MRKGGRLEAPLPWLRRRRSFLLLSAVALLYVLFLAFEFPLLFSRIASSDGASSSSSSGYVGDPAHRNPQPLDSEEETVQKGAPVRPDKFSFRASPFISPSPSGSRPRRRQPAMEVSGLVFRGIGGRAGGPFSELRRSAADAWEVGTGLLGDLRSGRLAAAVAAAAGERNRSEESCPHSISLSGAEFLDRGRVVLLPCGLTLGSHITLVARPYQAHPEFDPKISLPREGEQPVMVSQFMMELQGLRAVDGEDPPRILHFNPRLKGDWSGKPVIEQNTCYRMQWGTGLRCEGWKSRADEETVDGVVKCEKWIRDDDDHTEESKTTWWLNRLIGRTKKVSIDWPYPFVEDKLFVLTLSAGLEGYHINVDGRHVTSFPYRTGFVLEDATGLSLNGDLDVHSVFAASLPTSHPSFAPQRHLEMSSRWQALPLPNGPVELFIGILSAGNHFAERMAARKSWMQSISKSQNVVARFFVAMHARKEVNLELKKEAEFFGDIVVVPFMDSYDLVVLKTVAICEYGVRSVSAKYIMKCDDDTFVRVETVLKEVKGVPSDKSLYVGNINYYHKPLRQGKWAVTYEEWPEEDYPPYANGPGYVVSSDIAVKMTREPPPPPPTSPSLPWRTKLYISTISFITDFARRSNGTVNRRLLSLLDPPVAPNPNPVRGVRSADVSVDPHRNLWFRLFLPTSAAHDAALPVVVFFHGGGFAFMSPASRVYDDVCRLFCREIPAAVLSVNYRLSPEHKYPAPYDDGLDVLRFLGSQGGGGYDRDGPGGALLGEFFEVADLSSCFLAGDSAGGNISHNVARRWIAAGESPARGRVALAGLVAIQPYFGGEARVESEIRLSGVPLVNTERTDWFWKAFLPEGADRDHEAANPVASVEGLGEGFPPAMVVVGGFDPLQDWQRRYYEGLKGKGKEARLVEYPAAIHAFYVFPELKGSAALVEELKGFIHGCRRRGHPPAGDKDVVLENAAVP